METVVAFVLLLYKNLQSLLIPNHCEHNQFAWKKAVKNMEYEHMVESGVNYVLGCHIQLTVVFSLKNQYMEGNQSSPCTNDSLFHWLTHYYFTGLFCFVFYFLSTWIVSTELKFHGLDFACFLPDMDDDGPVNGISQIHTFFMKITEDLCWEFKRTLELVVPRYYKK